MDDEQKQNIRKKRKHDSEANVDQPNIAQITEGFQPQHAPLPEETSAAATQNVATNTVVPIQNADPMMPRPINNTRNRVILNSSATYLGHIARLHIPRMPRPISNTRNRMILNSSATYVGQLVKQRHCIHIPQLPRMPRPINNNQLMLNVVAKHFRERVMQGIGIHIPEEQSASNSLVQGQSSTSSDIDTDLQTETTSDAPTDDSSRPIEPNTSDEGTSNQSRNIQTEATPNAPTDDSSRPKPKASDAGTSNQSRNMQTEPTLNVPTDDSSSPMPKASDAGSSSQSSS